MPGERIIVEVLPAPAEVDELFRRFEAARALEYLDRLTWLQLVSFAASRRRADPSFQTLTYPVMCNLAAEEGFAQEDADAGWELVLNGQLDDDLAEATRHWIRETGRIPPGVEALLRDPPAAVDVDPAVFDPPVALPTTFWSWTFDQVRAYLGRPTHERRWEKRDLLFREVLGDVYEEAAPESLRRWALELTRLPAVQVALMAYARFYGVALRREDIMEVHDALAAGDLRPVLEAALAYFQGEGDDAAYRFLTV